MNKFLKGFLYLLPFTLSLVFILATGGKSDHIKAETKEVLVTITFSDARDIEQDCGEWVGDGANGCIKYQITSSADLATCQIKTIRSWTVLRHELEHCLENMQHD